MLLNMIDGHPRKELLPIARFQVPTNHQTGSQSDLLRHDTKIYLQSSNHQRHTASITRLITSHNLSPPHSHGQYILWTSPARAWSYTLDCRTFACGATYSSSKHTRLNTNPTRLSDMGAAIDRRTRQHDRREMLNIGMSSHEVKTIMHSRRRIAHTRTHSHTYTRTRFYDLGHETRSPIRSRKTD